MSRSRSRSRAVLRVDEGFTLIEVMVALTIFALFTTAVVPLLITALRASTVAKLDTGARNLTQERLEKMRTLPFHTPQASGAGNDLLDTYFPGTGTAATGVDAAGYVAAASAHKAGEPAGALYRYLVPAAEMAPVAATADTFSRYTQRVATQFLNATGQPFAPASWDSLTSPADEAVPSFIVRATVTTTWKTGALSKSYSVSTNIGEGRSAPAVARGEVRATAFRMSSSLPDVLTNAPSDLLFEGGVVTIDGEVGRGAKVASSSRGALASLVPGSRKEGASAGATSPANATASAADGVAQTLLFGTDEVVHFGSTAVRTSTTSADGGQMRAGTSTDPVGAQIKTGNTMRFTNRPDIDTSRLALKVDSPMVFSDGAGGKNAKGRATLLSTGTSSHTVSATATTTTPVLAVLPTTFAPGGLLQVEINDSSLACSAGVGATAPTLTYTATISYWRYDPVTKTEGYAPTPIVVTEASTSDAFAALLGSGPDTDTVAHVDALGQKVMYREYFSRLTSATATSLADERTVTAAGHTASHPGLLTISTVSLRTAINAPITLQLGVMSCSLEDAR